MKETYGVPVEEIQEAIKHGVRKINIDTDIRLAMTGGDPQVPGREPGEVRPARLPEAGARGGEEDLPPALPAVRLRRPGGEDRGAAADRRSPGATRRASWRRRSSDGRARRRGRAAPLCESTIRSLPLVARGKVRDNYAVGGDRMLMVASDRLSAFDVVMGEPIPGKGEVLTQMALFWFERLTHVVPNHLTGDDPESVVARRRARAGARPGDAGQAPEAAADRGGGARLPGRQRLEGIPGERPRSAACRCRRACSNASKLPTPIFTPATKAEAGDTTRTSTSSAPRRSSAPSSRRACATSRSASTARRRRSRSPKGIIIADTKFEFGLDADGTLTLMDEMLTPDSSRFWPADGYVEGANPPSYDKQFVRDWLESVRIDGKPWPKTAPAPALPAEVVGADGARTYRDGCAERA